MRFPAARIARLASGLTIRAVEHLGPPVVQWIWVVPTGSATDPETQPGLAALTADLLDEGSTTLSALDLHAALDRIGARLGIQVGSDATTVSLTTLSRYAEEGLVLLDEIVTRPRFEPVDFERARDLRRSRLRQMRTVPGAVADRVYLERLYPDHPYGHLSIGTDESLSRLTVADVKQFYHEDYLPAQTTLVGVGALAHDTLIELAERVFGGRATGSMFKTAGDDSVEPAELRNPSAQVVIVDRPGAVQSELRIGHVGVARRIADYHAVLVLNMVLGGQFVSRLNRTLREEKGYTYGVRTSFDCRRWPGPFSMQGSVQADATVESVQEVLTQMASFTGDGPVTVSELDLACAALTRGFARGFETVGQVARGVVQLVQHDLPADDYDQFVPQIEAVDEAAVTAAAAEYLHVDRAVVVVVGPASQFAEGLAALGLGDPQYVEA
ncbi:MAG: hypothetical protein CL484_14010 [Acidobacteria bacterium]|nr:hypothetical protein [Acidobacteriota bacterium]